MSLKPIIDDIANRADEFLDGVTTRSDARMAVSGQLSRHYKTLSGIDRTRVIDGVLTLLEQEGFFQPGPGEADFPDGGENDNP